MKILVTGHEGFIGQNFVNSVLNKHEIAGWEWNSEKLPDVKDFDWVVHLGAISSTEETDVDRVILQNYEFSKWLYNECNHTGVNLQYASSASVYGNTDHFTENGKLQPQSPYAWSKYLFDRWVHQQRHNIIVQGFRYFNVYGPGESHKGNQRSVFHKFKEQAEENKEILVFEGSKKIKRDFICVADVVEIHKRFFDISQSGVWNVGTGSATSFYEIAAKIAEKTDAKIKEISIPTNIKQQYQYFTQSNNKNLQIAMGDYRFISPLDYIDTA